MNPVLVNNWRGNAIESRHRGAVSVVRSDGKQLLALGDVAQHTFPRSAIKYLQAIALLESGAVETFGLGDEHIALACASHNGESVHVDLATSWLERLGLGENDLECGASLPMHAATQLELLAAGAGPSRVHHNCSGKHLGLLSSCRHLGDVTHNYRLYQHPAQKRWFDVVESMSSTRIAQLPWGYDGCGIPCIALPLQRVALGMARFADPAGQNQSRQDAIAKIRTAVSEHAYLVAGKERLCTSLMQSLAPRVLVKVGAEGVYTASVPEHGLGIALKIDDGQDRAARVALGAVLQTLNVISVDEAQHLAEYFAPSLSNSRGDVIGRADAASEWDSLHHRG